MEKHSSRKWIVSFFALVLALVLLVSATVFVIDPFFQFRVKDNSYKLSAWFVSSGLIENYDYDTLIIGSSVTQNFNMDVFREELGAAPLHIGLSGIRPIEMKQMMQAAYDAGKADTYYLCVDTSFFTEPEQPSRYPQYLLKDDIFSRLRYFFSYEVWFRYIPVNLGLMVLDLLNFELPQKYEYSKSVDRLEDWSMNQSFGEEYVLDGYGKPSLDGMTADTDALYAEMISKIDTFLADFDYENGQHVFFFPPYSALYWSELEYIDKIDSILLAKQYFIEKANELGAKVYDFQAAEFTVELNNYSDIQHYSPEINDWMTRQFGQSEYVVTAQNCVEFQERLHNNTRMFMEKYVHLFR